MLTPELEAGKYEMTFYIFAGQVHSEIGGMNVYARKTGKSYGERVYYYSSKYNATINIWSRNTTTFSSDSPFHVSSQIWGKFLLIS